MLEKAFTETQISVEKLLNQLQHLNFISDKSNNQPGNRILNMCVMAKEQSFHVHFEAVGFQKLSAANTAKWMIATVEDIVKSDFARVNSFATNIYNLKQAVWDIVKQDSCFKHVFFVPCDSHGL